MTPRTLARRVAEHLAASEAVGEPSTVAVVVLLRILRRLADGEAFGSQATFARAIGVSAETFRARLRELGGMVIWPASGSTGSAPGQPQVVTQLVEAWLAGAWTPVCGADFRAEISTANGPLQPEKSTANLAYARGHASSSSHSESRVPSPESRVPSAFGRTDVPAAMDSPQELARDLELMVGVMRRSGIKVSPELREDVRSLWCGHYSVAEVEHGVREARWHGALNTSYVESVMRSERERAGVVEFAVGDGS